MTAQKMLNVINRWGGYSYMSRLADRFGSNQSKSPFCTMCVYILMLCFLLSTSPIPGLVCTYKHVDIYIWCMYTMVFFLRYLRCQRKVKGGRETYILLLFFILPLSLSLFLSRLDVLFPVVFVYLVYVYLSMCIQDDAYTHQDPFFF